MPSLAPSRSDRPKIEIDPEELPGDLIQPGHPLFGTVWVNRGRMSGVPCFTGTRVPVQNLFDYLAGGDPLGEFLVDFPGVTRRQAEAVIALATRQLLDQLPRA